MKIAFINIYQNKVNRGAETFISEISERLAMHHEVKIFDKLEVLKILGHFDVVVPTNGRLQVLLVRLITWLTGSKMVVSGQSGIGFDDRINLYTFPDAFVALSESAYKWAKKVNPNIVIKQIPNGTDLDKFYPTEKIKNNSAFLSNKIVLSVGAFTKEKRHELTIKAVSRLKDVKLVIVGGGGERKEIIKSLGEKLLEERFEILSVSPEKMPAIYRKANVLAFPSVSWESFGIVMVEAMATGIPIVATDDPIRREIVGNAGILVNPVDLDSFSQALEKALQTNWGNKPRRQAEKFNWEKISKDYEQLFLSLVK